MTAPMTPEGPKLAPEYVLQEAREAQSYHAFLNRTYTAATFADCITLIESLQAQLSAVAQQPPSPAISAIHDALVVANIEYAAYSCNGVNLVGDGASIKAAMSAFHSHSQIDHLKTQIRHLREECGKLHANQGASK